MSRIEDEDDEDELQMILEGRDVQQFREYNYRREDDRSQDSDSNSVHQRDEDSNSGHHKRQSFQSKKQRPEDNRKKNQIKRRISSSDSAHNSQVVDDFTNEELNPQEILNNENNDENVTKIKPKIRRIMKPRLLLNADKLMAKEGIAVLPQIFSDFKFGPKGSETKDLNTILFRMSHWSHRLFPSLTFDDFIDKCEQLGNKRQVKNFVAKIRNDEPLNLDPNSAPLEDDPQDFEDFNDKDFDTIIANSYKNVTEDNPNEELNTNDSESERQHFESDSLPSLESQLKSNEDKQKDIEVNDKQILSETDIHIDDPNEEELTEEQLLNEINCEDNTPFE